MFIFSLTIFKLFVYKGELQLMTHLLGLPYSKNCETRINVHHIMSLGNFTLN